MSQVVNAVVQRLVVNTTNRLRTRAGWVCVLRGVAGATEQSATAIAQDVDVLDAYAIVDTGCLVIHSIRYQTSTWFSSARTAAPSRMRRR